jgi:hypothetical protein
VTGADLSAKTANCSSTGLTRMLAQCGNGTGTNTLFAESDASGTFIVKFGNRLNSIGRVSETRDAGSNPVGGSSP